MSPYILETLEFDNPTLKSVTVSYLITLKHSARRDLYMHQLRKHRPTRRVVVIHNEGYKTSPKEGVNTPAQDLWHANQYIASISDAQLVLILEDDVMFSEEFHTMAPRVDELVTSKSHAPIAYALGVQAFFSFPISKHHVRVLSGGFSHAVVYSRAALDEFEDVSLPRCGLHDIMVFTKFRTYAPLRVCAYQIYERTPSARRWDALHVHHLIYTMCGQAALRHFQVLHVGNALGGWVLLLLVLLCAVRHVVRRSARSIGRACFASTKQGNVP